MIRFKWLSIFLAFLTTFAVAFALGRCTGAKVPARLPSRYDPQYTLREGGRLCDIAPTLLEVMDMPIPAEMTGKSLLVKKA